MTMTVINVFGFYSPRDCKDWSTHREKLHSHHGEDEQELYCDNNDVKDVLHRVDHTLEYSLDQDKPHRKTWT